MPTMQLYRLVQRAREYHWWEGLVIWLSVRRLELTAEVAPPHHHQTHLALIQSAIWGLFSPPPPLNILRRWWFLPPQTPTEGQTLPSTHTSSWWRLSPASTITENYQRHCISKWISIFAGIPPSVLLLFYPDGQVIFGMSGVTLEYRKTPELQGHAASSITSQ